MKPPAFQFYPDNFLGGTILFSAEEVGAYIRLLCTQWDLGFLPNDDAKLAAIARCSGNAIANIRHKFMLCDDGRLRNERMELEREKQRAYREKQAQNGAKRWAGNAKPDAVATPSLMPDAMPNACSPSPSPSPNSDSVAASGAERREIARTLPETLRTLPFREAWSRWVLYAADKNGGRAVPQATYDSHLTMCTKLGSVDAVIAIETAIERNLRSPAMPFSKPANGERPPPAAYIPAANERANYHDPKTS